MPELIEAIYLSSSATTSASVSVSGLFGEMASMSLIMSDGVARLRGRLPIGLDAGSVGGHELRRDPRIQVPLVDAERR